MWVRRIGKNGGSEIVTIPITALRALRWKQGDFVFIEMTGPEQLLVTKFDPAKVPDRVRDAFKPVLRIEYE